MEGTDRLRGEHYFTIPPKQFLDATRVLVHENIVQSLDKFQKVLQTENKSKSDAVTKVFFICAQFYFLFPCLS